MVQIINHPVAIAAAVAAVQRQSSTASSNDNEFNNRFFQQPQHHHHQNQQRFPMNRSNQRNSHHNSHHHSNPHHNNQQRQQQSSTHHHNSYRLRNSHQQQHHSTHHQYSSHHHHSNSNHHQQNHQQHHQHHHPHTPLLLDEDFTFISPLVKYSLFFFNLIFWLIGTSLICLGFWSFFEEEYQQQQYNNLFKLKNLFDLILHISIALICTGSVVFSMSLMGCLGALRENLCLIKLYSLMLLMLFVGEVTISSLAFIFPQTVLNFLKDNLSKDMITKYREDTNLQNLIDIIQVQFKCCGISDNGYKDWSKNIYFNCTKFNPSSERCAVPFSCCREIINTDINSMCGYNMQNLSSVVEINKYVYTRGCVEAISELVDRNMNFVAMICLGSALAQLFAMFLARSLQGQIYAQRARWM